jgi:hypothetical protein
MGQHGHPGSVSDMQGISVIGGYVYRGSDHPELEGYYIFADFLDPGSGESLLLMLNEISAGNWVLIQPKVFGDTYLLSEYLISFGVDEFGELLGQRVVP